MDIHAPSTGRRTLSRGPAGLEKPSTRARREYSLTLGAKRRRRWGRMPRPVRAPAPPLGRCAPRSGTGKASAGDDDDLAPRVAGVDVGDGVAGLAERIRPLDDRADRPGRDQPEQLAELRGIDLRRERTDASARPDREHDGAQHPWYGTEQAPTLPRHEHDAARGPHEAPENTQRRRAGDVDHGVERARGELGRARLHSAV